MISWLKKIFGREEKFFDLLEAGAQEAKTSVNLLASYLHTLSAGGPPANLDDFVQSRRKEKRIRHEMTEQLSRTFVTPLEREDIESLSFALYRIPKAVEKIVERLSIYPGRVPHAAFQRQADLLNLAADAVMFIARLTKMNVQINQTRQEMKFAGIQNLRFLRRKVFSPFDDPVTFDMQVHHFIDLVGRINDMSVPDDEILDRLPIQFIFHFSSLRSRDKEPPCAPRSRS